MVMQTPSLKLTEILLVGLVRFLAPVMWLHKEELAVGQFYKQPLYFSHDTRKFQLKSDNNQMLVWKDSKCTVKSSHNDKITTAYISIITALYSLPVSCRPAELAVCSYKHSPPWCFHARRWCPRAAQWGWLVQSWWPEHRPPHSPHPSAAASSYSWTLKSKDLFRLTTKLLSKLFTHSLKLYCGNLVNWR